MKEAQHLIVRIPDLIEIILKQTQKQNQHKTAFSNNELAISETIFHLFEYRMSKSLAVWKSSHERQYKDGSARTSKNIGKLHKSRSSHAKDYERGEAPKIHYNSSRNVHLRMYAIDILSTSDMYFKWV